MKRQSARSSRAYDGQLWTSLAAGMSPADHIDGVACQGPALTLAGGRLT